MQRDINRLRRWCIRRKLDKWDVTEICAHARIPRATFYVWWNKYMQNGWKGLEPKSRRPRTIHRTPTETVNEVIRLRGRYGWGPNKIEGHLKRHSNITGIGHNTIYRIICIAGLNNQIDKPRKQWGNRRFARNKPNELWQCDWKLTVDDEWMITYLDDHSRFVIGSEIYHNPTATNTIALLKQCLDLYGKPIQILTDRGTQFTPARGDISSFTGYCIQRGIEHIKASKRRPSTIGKVEAWHKAYEYEKMISHKEFVKYWNYNRPHQGIGYLYPAELYFHRTV